MLHKRMPPAACEEPSNRLGHSELGTGNGVRSQADPWEADLNERVELQPSLMSPMQENVTFMRHLKDGSTPKNLLQLAFFFFLPLID